MVLEFRLGAHLQTTHAGTVFVPTDESFVESASDLQEALGVSLLQIPEEPRAAAQVMLLLASFSLIDAGCSTALVDLVFLLILFLPQYTPTG